MGANANYANTDGAQNTAIGAFAMAGDSGTRNNNVAVGYAAMYDVTTGSQNVAVGRNAGANIEGANYNTFVGYYSGSNHLSGNGNTALGYNSAGSTTSGFDNVCLGQDAGSTITTGDHNICIGDNARGPSTGGSCVVIGAGANTGNTNNYVMIYNGNTNAYFTDSQTAWSFSSDGRDKTDIEDLQLGLNFVNKLTPRKFRWNYRDPERFPIDSKENPEILIKSGFIAQEVQAVCEEENAEFTQIVGDTDPDNLCVSHAGMVPMLVKAVQELTAKNEALEARLAALESK